jgi:hypothetical protein
VVDILAILINRAKNEGQIFGVIPNILDDGLSILQYADDTILFMDHNIEQARNMKVLLTAFEQLSDLKINYHKSELFCFGQAKDHELQYEQLYWCKRRSYSFIYLGIPMHYRKLYNSDWKIIEERIKKMSSWKGKYLSVEERLVLINSVLTSLLMFMLSFFEVPKCVLEKIEYFRSRFFGKMTAEKEIPTNEMEYNVSTERPRLVRDTEYQNSEQMFIKQDVVQVNKWRWSMEKDHKKQVSHKPNIRESTKETRWFTILGGTDECQTGFPKVRILPTSKWKTNPIFGRQMVG